MIICVIVDIPQGTSSGLCYSVKIQEQKKFSFRSTISRSFPPLAGQEISVKWITVQPEIRDRNLHHIWLCIGELVW